MDGPRLLSAATAARASPRAETAGPGSDAAADAVPLRREQRQYQSSDALIATTRRRCRGTAGRSTRRISDRAARVDGRADARVHGDVTWNGVLVRCDADCQRAARDRSTGRSLAWAVAGTRAFASTRIPGLHEVPRPARTYHFARRHRHAAACWRPPSGPIAASRRRGGPVAAHRGKSSGPNRSLRSRRKRARTCGGRTRTRGHRGRLLR